MTAGRKSCDMDCRSMSVVVVRIWEFHICTSLCTVIKQGKYSCCKNVFNKMRVKTFRQHYTFFLLVLQSTLLTFFQLVLQSTLLIPPTRFRICYFLKKVCFRKFSYHLILAFVMRGVGGGLSQKMEVWNFLCILELKIEI